jgi:hypothetical protein
MTSPDGRFEYNSPPNWQTPEGFVPPQGWLPEADWGPAPDDWVFWVPVRPVTGPPPPPTHAEPPSPVAPSVGRAGWLRGWRWKLVSLLLLLLAAVAIVIYERWPRTTLVGGVVTLYGYQSIEFPEGEGGTCFGANNDGDLADGASVTIKDPSGTIIGTATLVSSRYHKSSGYTPPSCVFDFSATVPKKSFYQIDVAGRGDVTVQYSDASTNSIDISIGK